MQMTSSEMRCKNMADVCRLAHIRTVNECKKRGNIVVDCISKELCGYDDNDHDHTKLETKHYTALAQAIFDKHYDYICEVTGI